MHRGGGLFWCSGAEVEKELRSFEEDLLIADLNLVTSRVKKRRDSVKRPRPNRDKEFVELEALEPLLMALESGQPTHEMELSEGQGRAIKSFQLLTRKPRKIIVNTNDHELPSEEPGPGHSSPVWRLPITLQLELGQM